MLKWLRKLLSRKVPENQDRLFVDRDGVIYLPVRPVKLRANRKQQSK